MSASHTAQLYQFPSRSPSRVQPMGLDLSRAVPADAAAIEAHRVRLNTLQARTEGDRDELVSALLLTLENNPSAPCLAYPSRDIARRPFVAVIVAGIPFRLQPGDCRLAATALIAEQAFVGCMQAAHDLREAANLAEQRCNAAIVKLASPSRTGRATTLILLAIVAVASAAATLFGR